MIYVEIVKLINNQVASPRNDEFIQKINSIKNKYNGNAQHRLYQHYINMVIGRLDKMTEVFVSSVKDTNSTQIAIEEIKKESNYCKELAKVNLIDPETQLMITGHIDDYLQQIEKQFKELFIDSENEELSLLAHNINLGG